MVTNSFISQASASLLAVGRVGYVIFPCNCTRSTNAYRHRQYCCYYGDAWGQAQGLVHGKRTVYLGTRPALIPSMHLSLPLISVITVMGLQRQAWGIAPCSKYRGLGSIPSIVKKQNQIKPREN